MNINSINNMPFRAEISRRFLVPAQRHLENASYRQQVQFEDNVDMFENMPNTQGITISYERVSQDGKIQHALVAQKGDKKVVLSTKDQFRKIVEKFSHMNEYEFKTKWEQQKGI